MAEYSLNVWKTHFLKLSPTIEDGQALPALLSLPLDYEPFLPVRRPLVVFLHGRGERGRDLEALLRYGVPPLVLAREDFPFITLSPQCPEDSEWGDRLAGVLDLLRFVSTTFAVDSQRTYLTGLSMGGRGAWQLAVEHPERFAAVVSICGRVPAMPDFFDRLPVLRDKPIWVFHGAQDEVVPIADSNRIVAALRNIGSDVRYTVYPDAGHDSWTPAYAEEELWAWIGGQRPR